jgi:hypothetical protein
MAYVSRQVYPDETTGCRGHGLLEQAATIHMDESDRPFHNELAMAVRREFWASLSSITWSGAH